MEGQIRQGSIRQNQGDHARFHPMTMDLMVVAACVATTFAVGNILADFWVIPLLILFVSFVNEAVSRPLKKAEVSVVELGLMPERAAALQRMVCSSVRPDAEEEPRMQPDEPWVRRNYSWGA